MSAITILKNNEPTGPFTREEVAARLNAGACTLDDLAFVEGLTEWTPLHDVLARVDGTAPAPVAPASLAESFATAPITAPVAYRGYAGFWLRLAAILIDGIIIFAVIMALDVIIGILVGIIFGAAGLARSGSFEHSPVATALGLVLYVLNFVLQWLYFALLESGPWQGTIGKKVLGLRVTNLAGDRIGFGRATGRYFGKIVSGFTLLIGYIMAGFTERKQALHDLIASTLVVRK